MNCKIVKKYWYRTELKGLNEKRILDIVKWLINIVLKLYNKYIELYDFDNLL